MATEEIQISQLELADDVLADMVFAVDTSTDTKAVTLKQLKAWLGSGLPLGFIVPAVGKINDGRFTLLDGKSLARTGAFEGFCNKVVEQVQAGNWTSCTETEYAQDIADYGQCGKFVVTNDYVRIPTITKFIGATVTLSEIGKTYNESLPNITGTFPTATTAGSYSGAFSKGTVYSGNGQNAQPNMQVNFSAADSNSIYTDGASVQPINTRYPYYMIVSTDGQTAEVDIDVNQVYSDIALKADKNLGNIPTNYDYVVENYQNGTNWYRAYKSGWIEQGGVADGNSTINFLKPFADTNYCLAFGTKSTNYTYNSGGLDRTTTGFRTLTWSWPATYFACGKSGE